VFCERRLYRVSQVRGTGSLLLLSCPILADSDETVDDAEVVEATLTERR